MSGWSGKFAFVRNDGHRKALKALLEVPTLEMGKIVEAAMQPGVGTVLARARSLAPKDTTRLASSIRATEFIEKFKNKGVAYAQGVRVGDRNELGITGRGFYPASMEFGFRFPPKDMEDVRSTRYAFQSKADLTKTGKGMAAKIKRINKARERRERHLMSTMGGHVYFDKRSGNFRRSPTGWRHAGHPYLRPALYRSKFNFLGSFRTIVMSRLESEFKKRLDPA